MATQRGVPTQPVVHSFVPSASPEAAPEWGAARVHLVRHGDAVQRRAWDGPELLRPLTGAGERQARALAARLCPAPGDAARPAGVLSSPASRCLETVRPTAVSAGLVVEEVEDLREGSDPMAALALLVERAGALGAGKAIVACSHGDVVYGVLDALAASGTVLDGLRAVPKASTWELDVVGDVVRTARFVAPPS